MKKVLFLALISLSTLAITTLEFHSFQANVTSVDGVKLEEGEFTGNIHCTWKYFNIYNGAPSIFMQDKKAETTSKSFVYKVTHLQRWFDANLYELDFSSEQVEIARAVNINPFLYSLKLDSCQLKISVVATATGDIKRFNKKLVIPFKYDSSKNLSDVLKTSLENGRVKWRWNGAYFSKDVK